MRLVGPAVLLCVLATACGEPRFDAPEPLELAPTSARADASVEVVIRGRHFLPRVEADYASREDSQVDGTFRARLGEVPLEDVTFVSTTELRGRVPAWLAAGRYELVVVDPSGAEGRLAEAFEVLPFRELVLDTPEQTVGAGECSRPVGLAVRNERGELSPLDAPLDVALTSSPPKALSFFADPGCSTAIEGVSLAAGEPRQQVYFSATRMGPARLTGTSALGKVEQRMHIVAGALAELAWQGLSSPQRVNSPITVRVEALDRFGNRTNAGFSVEITASQRVPLSCLEGCNGNSLRGRFNQGVLTATVAVGTATRGLRLGMSQGNISSVSNAFDVTFQAADGYLDTPDLAADRRGSQP